MAGPGTKETVQVVVRVRPLNTREEQQGSPSCIRLLSGSSLQVRHLPQPLLTGLVWDTWARSLAWSLMLPPILECRWRHPGRRWRSSTTSGSVLGQRRHRARCLTRPG